MTESEFAAQLDPDALKSFTDDVRDTLVRGGRHKTPGFGTFTRCTRKAKGGRPACTIAMWRASDALRDQVGGQDADPVTGPHAPVLNVVIEAMLQEGGVDVPRLGHLAAVRQAGKKPRLIFHATDELNEAINGG